MPKKPSIYYLVPDYDTPSWGIGLLYRHVAMLREHGLSAHILHHARGFGISWLETAAPVVHLDDPSFRLADDDVLVVPELLAKEGVAVGPSSRKVVFVQGSFLILKPFDEAVSYADLGYERAMVILPHVKEVVERHFGMTADIVPPFIAPYFFAEAESINHRPRARRILMFPKEGYREAGFFDYEIVRKLLRRRCEQHPRWELREVSGLGHHAVADLMRQSVFIINVNCLEAFNTTVPEAMAAGCIPVCYEAFGGKDFLVNGHNAFVFKNNDVYPLVEKIESLMDTFDRLQDQLAKMRSNAFETACTYGEQATEQALIRFFRSLGF